MHMLSRTDLSSAELETLQRSRSPTTVITANGEVQTNEEATVHIHDLELFVTVQILDDTPAVVSLGRLCEEHGYSYEWTSGQKPTADQDWDKFCVIRKTSCLLLSPGLSTGSSSSSASSSSTSLPQDTSGGIPPLQQYNEVTIPTLEHREIEAIQQKIKTKTTTWTTSQAPSDRVRDLRVWLVEFTENLEDTEVPALRDTPANTSQDSDSERPVEVVLRKAQY